MPPQPPTSTDSLAVWDLHLAHIIGGLACFCGLSTLILMDLHIFIIGYCRLMMMVGEAHGMCWPVSLLLGVIYVVFGIVVATSDCICWQTRAFIVSTFMYNVHKNDVRDAHKDLNLDYGMDFYRACWVVGAERRSNRQEGSGSGRSKRP